jgi:ABC-type multidrug transport system ATPase subunit
MVCKPSLVILDEPTSGLDSNKAARVLKVLKKLANEGHSIIFTIHQPSFLLYSMLSRLILLNSGHTLYQGEANQIKNYLENLNINVPKTSTICDFFML